MGNIIFVEKNATQIMLHILNCYIVDFDWFLVLNATFSYDSNDNTDINKQ